MDAGADGAPTGATAMKTDDAERSDEAMFEESEGVRFADIGDLGKAWWLCTIHDGSGLTPRDIALALAGADAGEREATWTRMTARGASLLIERPHWKDERYDVTDDRLILLGPAFRDPRMFAAAAMKGPGRFFGMLPGLIDTARSFGAGRIETDAIHDGRYALVRAGFLPDPPEWKEIKLQALLLLVMHEHRLPPGSAPEIMRRVERAGPSGARFLAALASPVPSRALPEKFGVPQQVPFGAALFVEEGDDWWGRLHLRDRRSLAIAREAGELSHPSWRAPIHQTMLPQHRGWAFLETNPWAVIGAAGPMWRAGALQAWCDAGGTADSFEQIFGDTPIPAPAL
jgi:hypothetical protein